MRHYLNKIKINKILSHIFAIFFVIGSHEAILELFKAGSDCNKHEKDGLTGDLWTQFKAKIMKIN